MRFLQWWIGLTRQNGLLFISDYVTIVGIGKEIKVLIDR